MFSMMVKRYPERNAGEMKKTQGNESKTSGNRYWWIQLGGLLLAGAAAAVMWGPWLGGVPLAAARSACQAGGPLVQPDVARGLVREWRFPCGWVAVAWWSWAAAGLLGLLAAGLGRAL